MKRRITIAKAIIASTISASTISCLISAFGMQAVQAQIETSSQPPSPEAVDSTVHPLQWMNQQGTSALQEKVLMQINQGLFDGWLSAADASQFKAALNKVNDQESWYKSLNSSIPAILTEKNKQLLNAMSEKLQPRTTVSTAVENALDSDIDELISKALAHNHISTGQAEKYYLRLAQLESNLESAKGNQTGMSDQATEMNKSLRELKSELITK